MSEKAILTTVVGSYPVPSWLAAMPSTPNLRDAVLTVLKTLEVAHALGSLRLRILDAAALSGRSKDGCAGQETRSLPGQTIAG